MKRVALLFCFMFLAGTLMSQTAHFSFGYHEKGIYYPVPNGSTITFSVQKDKILDATVGVKNEQNLKRNLSLKKFYVKKAPLPFTDLFCWDQCYSRPDIMESVNPVIFLANELDTNHLHLTYVPNSHEGETIIRYRVWDKSAPQDTGFVFVRFVASTTSLDELQSLHQVTVSPNPCNAYATFSFNSVPDKGTTIQLYDLVGRSIRQIQCNEGIRTVRADLTDLEAGIYLYQVESRGLKGPVKKLMVQR
jgi:hypothetical protein